MSLLQPRVAGVSVTAPIYLLLVLTFTTYGTAQASVEPSQLSAEVILQRQSQDIHPGPVAIDHQAKGSGWLRRPWIKRKKTV